MPLAAIIWLVSMLVIITSTYEYFPIAAYGVFGVLAILFFSGSDRLAFFNYVLFTVGTVFIFLILAFKDVWTSTEQAQAIGLHFLILIHLFALYSLSKYVYQFRTENSFLRERVLRLEDFISEEGVLTKQEFEKQSTMILATMARRNETGYYIRIDVSALPRRTRRTAMTTIGSIVKTTVRDHYDIVGKIDEHTIGFLLQNTSEEGMNIVKSRLDNNLHDRFEEQALEDLKWTVKMLEGKTSVQQTEVLS